MFPLTESTLMRGNEHAKTNRLVLLCRAHRGHRILHLQLLVHGPIITNEQNSS